MWRREGNQEVKTPRSCQERWLLSSLSCLSSLRPDLKLKSLSSRVKRDFSFTVIEITDRHTRLHTSSVNVSLGASRGNLYCHC